MYTSDRDTYESPDELGTADLAMIGAFLVGVNVLISACVPYFALQQSPAYQGNHLLSIGLGWQAAQVPLLSLWLTWGGPWLVPRLVAVLGTLAIAWAAQTRAWNAASVIELDFGSLLMSLVLVLAVHALLIPLRDLAGWRLVRRIDAAPVEPRMQWSLMHLFAWMVFLAAPLTFMQMLGELADASLSKLESTVMIAGALFDGLVRTGIVMALMLACLARGWKLAGRLVAIVGSFVVAFAYRIMLIGAAGIAETMLQSEAWSSNLWLSGLVNAVVLNLAGLQAVRVRPLGPPDHPPGQHLTNY